LVASTLCRPSLNNVWIGEWKVDFLQAGRKPGAQLVDARRHDQVVAEQDQGQAHHDTLRLKSAMAGDDDPEGLRLLGHADLSCLRRSACARDIASWNVLSCFFTLLHSWLPILVLIAKYFASIAPAVRPGKYLMRPGHFFLFLMKSSIRQLSAKLHKGAVTFPMEFTPHY
jgi:hypothetical protein